MSYFELLYNKYNKLLLTKKEIAEELGVSEATLNRKLESGEFDFAYINTGRKYFFTLKSFSEFLENYEQLVA